MRTALQGVFTGIAILCFAVIILFVLNLATMPNYEPIDYSFQGLSLGDPIAAVESAGYEKNRRDWRKKPKQGCVTEARIEIVDGVVGRIATDGYSPTGYETALIEKFGEPHIKEHDEMRWKTTGGTWLRYDRNRADTNLTSDAYRDDRIEKSESLTREMAEQL